MYKRVIVWVVILFLTLPAVQAQEHSFTYYDSLTYQLFQNRNYKELKKTGKHMLSAGYDYYYLRMRLGIAAYEQKQYRVAANHFEKALSFNNNYLVKEYLYYSNLWGGEPLQVLRIANSMPDKLKQELKINRSTLISLDGSISTLFLNDPFPQNISFPQEDGSQIITKSFINTKAELKQNVGKKTALTYMFNYLHKSSEKYFYEDGYSYLDTTFRVNQYQYYFGGSTSIGKRWVLTYVAHLASVNYPYFYKVEDSDSVVFKETTDKYTDLLFSVSVLKNFNRFSMETEMVLMNIADQWVFQPTAIVRLYPFANLNFYTQSQFSWQIKQNKTTFFQQQKIGFKAFNYLWLEGDYFNGNVTGFSLNNGSLLFNELEEINSMWGAKAIVPATPKLTFTFGYQNREQTNYFINKEDVTSKSNPIKLNYSLIYMSLQWKL